MRVGLAVYAATGSGSYECKWEGPVCLGVARFRQLGTLKSDISSMRLVPTDPAMEALPD